MMSMFPTAVDWHVSTTSIGYQLRGCLSRSSLVMLSILELSTHLDLFRVADVRPIFLCVQCSRVFPRSFVLHQASWRLSITIGTRGPILALKGITS